MSVALVCTWRPRGELPRLQRLRAELEARYNHIIVAVPPTGCLADAEPLRAWPTVRLLAAPGVGTGRYLAIQAGLETTATHLHYADLDGLVPWIERRPDEWRDLVARIETTDCLIVGRSERAFQTRPPAIRQTERIINAVASHLLGQTVDCGLGERGFSRRAVDVMQRHTAPPGWFDVAWPVLVQRAGMRLTYLVVDGVDWETPDHQPAIMAHHDQDARHWAFRVEVARTIIEEALAAARRPLTLEHGAEHADAPAGGQQAPTPVGPRPFTERRTPCR